MRFLKPSLVMTAGLALVGCLDKLSTSLEPETGAGLVYTLITVNDLNLPAVIHQAQSRVEVRKGALTLAPDSTWILSYVVHTSAAGSEQTNIATLKGTYTVANTALTLSLTGSTTVYFAGTYSPTDVALRDVTVAEGLRFGFRR